MHETKLFFKENGYVVFKNLFPQTIITELHSIVSKSTSVGSNVIVSNLIEKHTSIVLKFICNEFILDFLESVMGPFIQLDGLTLRGTLPVKANEQCVLDWHRDPWAMFNPNGFYQNPLAINVLLYLQDLTPRSGPLRVIPGSHKENFEITENNKTGPIKTEKLLFLEKGDVAILHNMCVHSKTHSIDGCRYYLSALYNHSWLKQTYVFDIKCIEELIVDAFVNKKSRWLRLFGIDKKLKERTNLINVATEQNWAEWIYQDNNDL